MRCGIQRKIEMGEGEGMVSVCRVKNRETKKKE